MKQRAGVGYPNRAKAPDTPGATIPKKEATPKDFRLFACGPYSCHLSAADKKRGREQTKQPDTGTGASFTSPASDIPTASCFWYFCEECQLRRGFRFRGKGGVYRFYPHVAALSMVSGEGEHADRFSMSVIATYIVLVTSGFGMRRELC